MFHSKRFAVSFLVCLLVLSSVMTACSQVQYVGVTRDHPGTKYIQTGSEPIDVYCGVYFGTWFTDEEVILPEVWSCGIYHGAGIIDVACTYMIGEIKVALVGGNIDAALDALAKAEPRESTWVMKVRLEPDTQYKVSLHRPPAPPDMEYPVNPRLFYFAIGVMGEGFTEVSK